MKKSLYTLLSISLVIAILALSGCAMLTGGKSDAAKEKSALGPVVVVATPHVAMEKKTEVVVMGTGFQPGKEIAFLITDADGVLTDITSAMKPEPKADKSGTWASTWDASDYVKNKLVKKGVYVITAADSEYNPIALAPVNFYEPPKKDDKEKKEKK
jgi:hypothetical protein